MTCVILFLPSDIFLEISAFCYHHELIVGFLSSCKGLAHQRATYIRCMKEKLTELTKVVATQHDLDLFAFLDNIESIREHRVPLFNQLPPRVLMDPLLFVLHAVTRTIMGNAHISDHESLIPNQSPLYFTHQLHAFRFNWLNTRSASVYDDGTRMRMTNFLYSLEEYELILNEGLRADLRLFLGTHPQWTVALEKFLNQRLVHLSTHFEGDVRKEHVCMKRCHLTVSVNVQFIENMTLVRNAFNPVDSKCLVCPNDFKDQSAMMALIDYCLHCSLSKDHEVLNPALFIGVRMSWFYKNNMRSQSNQCAVFPVTQVACDSHMNAFFKLSVTPLPVDHGHLHVFHNTLPSPLDFSSHECEPRMELMLQWPADVSVRSRERLDTQVSDILLLFFR